MFVIERVFRRVNGENKEIKFLAGLGNLTQDLEARRVNTRKGETFVVGGYDKRFGRSPAIAFNYWENKEKKAVYYQLEAWGGTAQMLGQLGKKGAEMSVCGRIEQRTSKNQETGREYVNETLIIERFQLTSRNERIVTGSKTSQSVGISKFSPMDEDIPF